jgi:hypothetical protein
VFISIYIVDQEKIFFLVRGNIYILAQWSGEKYLPVFIRGKYLLLLVTGNIYYSAGKNIYYSVGQEKYLQVLVLVRG